MTGKPDVGFDIDGVWDRVLVDLEDTLMRAGLEPDGWPFCRGLLMIGANAMASALQAMSERRDRERVLRGLFEQLQHIAKDPESLPPSNVVGTFAFVDRSRTTH